MPHVKLDSNDVLDSAIWEIVCRVIDKKLEYLIGQIAVEDNPNNFYRLQGQIYALKCIRNKEDFDV